MNDNNYDRWWELYDMIKLQAENMDKQLTHEEVVDLTNSMITDQSNTL